MKDNTSPLFSQYIIDGIRMDETPFSALYDCMDRNGCAGIPDERFQDIIDECPDKKPVSFAYEFPKAAEYLKAILKTHGAGNAVNTDYPVSWTKNAVAALLLDYIFKDGHFTLQDTTLTAIWKWDNEPAGNMAAFYDSAVTAGHYIFDLGLKLSGYSVESTSGECTLNLDVQGNLKRPDKCPRTMFPDNDSWLIYVPFGIGRMNLGGSALSTAADHGSGVEPDFHDPDYFIDCYEVVRELVEDGIIKAGIPTGYGGLLAAAEKFRGESGFTLEIGGIMSALTETDPINVLFAEMPGVLVQIKDADYDYVDSQFLLQEVAYYPVGHPGMGTDGIGICRDDRNNVAGILNSLMGIS